MAKTGARPARRKPRKDFTVDRVAQYQIDQGGFVYAGALCFPQ
jgi:hypothetical protein